MIKRVTTYLGEGPNDTSPERANIPKSFVTQEVKNPTTDDREEEVLPI